MKNRIYNSKNSFFKIYVISILTMLTNFFTTKKNVEKLIEKNLEELKKNKEKELTIFVYGIRIGRYGSLFNAINWFKKRGLIMIPIECESKGSVPYSAKKIKLQIKKIMQKTNAKKINIIGFSYGGFVIRYYSEMLGGYKIINKIVTVCGPYNPLSPKKSLAFWISKFTGGDPVGDNIMLKKLQNKYSVKNHLSIYSLKDWILPRKDTKSYKAQEIAIRGGHLFISYNLDISEIILDYLKK
ncbi:MAG: alpha/beta hydrolase [Nanoarchaeota archaeon]|nr:alpha/beta hydrolase [Nanoarchaeota archaeon]